MATAYAQRTIDTEIINLSGNIFGDACHARGIDSLRPAPQVARRRTTVRLSSVLAGTFLGAAFGSLLVLASVAVQPKSTASALELERFGPAAGAIASAASAPSQADIQIEETIVRGSLPSATPAGAWNGTARPTAAPQVAAHQIAAPAPTTPPVRVAETPAAAPSADAPAAAPSADAPATAPSAEGPATSLAANTPIGPGINTSAAATAIAIAAARAGGCVAPDDPRTTMSVRVTFAPSGRVTTALVSSGPFTGTDVGGCVARALRSATVAPFDGPAVTLRRSVSIR